VIVLLIIFLVLSLLFVALLLATIIKPPKETEAIPCFEEPVQSGESSWRSGKNWFRKSASGLWELYVEGKPFERGFHIGRLTKDLLLWQESIFFREVSKMVPSKVYLYFLKLLVAFVNRRLEKHIGKEYCSEIHGVSLAAPKTYAHIGPAYQRYLNYHAAHDIGHTLHSFHLVGCTAFSVWGSRTADGAIITGRNFDFYLGDDFSKEKIVSFYKPDQGYRFAAITWGGMIGCTSGMNEHGLCVTVNGAQSEFPNRSATPVAILIREVLQYATNIEEAFAIIKKRRIFVSESLMLSSAQDHKTVVIEKSRSQAVLFESGTDQLICTNHFQSPELGPHPSNQKYMAESPSVYRYQRVEELLRALPVLSEADVASVLRNKKGLGGEELGMGNEKAVDQMLAHHSIIFKPEQRIFWISCGPYPEGAYKAYDLNKIFADGAGTDETTEICSESLTIPQDPFLETEEYKKYVTYKTLQAEFISKVGQTDGLDHLVESFIASNPESYMVYTVLGDYYYDRGVWDKAKPFYETGLQKHVPNLHEAKHMQKRLAKAKLKMNHRD